MRRSVLKVLSGRDGEMFPCLEEALWGDAFSRYEIWCVCERKTGVKRIVDSYFTPKRRTVLPIDCFVPVPKKTPRNRTNRRHIPLSRHPLTAQLLLSPQHAHRTPQTHSRQLRRPRRHPPPIDHDTLQQVLRITPPCSPHQRQEALQRRRSRLRQKRHQEIERRHEQQRVVQRHQHIFLHLR